MLHSRVDGHRLIFPGRTNGQGHWTTAGVPRWQGGDHGMQDAGCSIQTDGDHSVTKNGGKRPCGADERDLWCTTTVADLRQVFG